MSRLSLIIAAGGSSQRFGGNKLLLPLGEYPVFCHCLANLARCSAVRQIIFVAPGESLEQYRQLLRLYLPELADRVQLVPGGGTRTQSVLNGLQAVSEDCDYVAVHDAARPLVTASLLRRCLESAEENGAAIPAHRIADTIKRGDAEQFVVQTVDRSSLWGVETPQVVRRRILLDAYSRQNESEDEPPPTDEAQLLERCGYPVAIVESTIPNMKITYPGDQQLVKALLGL